MANYADDNSPFAFGETIPKVISQLEAEVLTILKWVNDNGLKANPDKFHLLLSDADQKFHVKVGELQIGNINTEKLLGIKIDNKLSFENHVSDICSKVSQKLHALSRVSQFMSLDRRKELMNAFILSQFGYCALVWMFHSRKLNHRINTLHERALRIVYRDNESTFDTLLEKSESFRIHERNIQTWQLSFTKYGMIFLQR